MKRTFLTLLSVVAIAICPSCKQPATTTATPQVVQAPPPEIDPPSPPPDADAIAATEPCSNQEPPPALSSAVLNADLSKVKSLLNAGADINQVDGCGATPLMMAFTMAIAGPTMQLHPSRQQIEKERSRLQDLNKKRLQIASWLLDQGADPLRADAYGQTSLAYAAAFYGSEDLLVPLIERMLAAGDNVNRADIRGSTPLMMAAFEGHPRVVTYLLSKGASPDIRDKSGKTALDVARDYGRKDVVDILEEGKAHSP